MLSNFQSFLSAEPATVYDRLLIQRPKAVLEAVNDAVRLYPSGPSVTFRYVLSKACCGVVTIGRWEQVYELDELSAHQKEHTAYSTSSIVPWIIKIDLVSSSSDPSATFFEGEKHFAALGIDVNSLEVEATCGRISVMTLVKDDSAVDGRSYMTQPTLMPAEQLLSQLHDAQMTNPFASMYDKVCGMFGSHSSTSGYVKIYLDKANSRNAILSLKRQRRALYSVHK